MKLAAPAVVEVLRLRGSASRVEAALALTLAPLSLTLLGVLDTFCGGTVGEEVTALEQHPVENLASRVQRGY